MYTVHVWMLLLKYIFVPYKLGLKLSEKSYTITVMEIYLEQNNTFGSR